MSRPIPPRYPLPHLPLQLFPSLLTFMALLAPGLERWAMP